MLAARCSLLAVRCSLLAARCSLLAARCSLLAARCSLLGARPVVAEGVVDPAAHGEGVHEGCFEIKD